MDRHSLVALKVDLQLSYPITSARELPAAIHHHSGVAGARVEQIAALRERMLAATVEVPWIPALQKDTRTRNTHSSTAIEGNPLTLEQVCAVEEGRERGIPTLPPGANRTLCP
jgi:Fic family protein